MRIYGNDQEVRLSHSHWSCNERYSSSCGMPEQAGPCCDIVCTFGEPRLEPSSYEKHVNNVEPRSYVCRTIGNYTRRSAQSVSVPSCKWTSNQSAHPWPVRTAPLQSSHWSSQVMIYNQVCVPTILDAPHTVHTRSWYLL